MHLNTFSIVAYDPDEKAWGVAVASKFLAAGAVVNWAQANAGAVATQSYAKVSFGADGLKMMADGMSATETLTALLADDPGREQRQVGLVDREGHVAAHTGKNCHEWAGHRIGEGFTVQGNILTGSDVLESMSDAYTAAKGELADRLVAALLAGSAAGGDKRGKQAAAVLVVCENGGYGGDNDRYIDLRVDDDETPIRKLRQLLDSHHLFFGIPKKEDRMRIDTEIASELQRIMMKQGYWSGEVDGSWDAISQQAFWTLIGNENLEERWNMDKDPSHIDRVALEYLRRRFG
ncbi:DUF1028 domain-containing protein [Phototrophicus methaneseepsis]|uniref:DUF1028 domain-containing protein n=1 Tax=Phototrophicus methaneseepsis TaxID=2710758 RepID=A0A7S8ECD8_9CHLR|nr:DUF1028 domain-containing protein [Phototrophicus methaneseepsis]QPC84380.1 DUF1028 domain-containing protein [Phototrophicus methaneseepsis]